MPDFDFDYWMNLAAVDPARFERERKAALLELAETAPESARAGLVTLVTSICAPNTGSAKENMEHAQALMLESLSALGTKMQELQIAVGALPR